MTGIHSRYTYTPRSLPPATSILPDNQGACILLTSPLLAVSSPPLGAPNLTKTRP